MNMFENDFFVLYAHVCVTGHKQAGMFHWRISRKLSEVSDLHAAFTVHM